jgi:hypothetical protein
VSRCVFARFLKSEFTSPNLALSLLAGLATIKLSSIIHSLGKDGKYCMLELHDPQCVGEP